jgi:hypothetical protein
MFGRKELKETSTSAAEFARELAGDKKFRKQLIDAVSHGKAAKRRARPRVGAVAVAARLASDQELQRQLKAMRSNVEGAWKRVEKKRSHKLRNFLLTLVGAGVAAAGVPQARKWIGQKLSGGSSGGDDSTQS